MGVKGLLHFLKKSCPSSYSNLLTLNRPIILLVDFYAFLFYILENFGVTNSPGLPFTTSPPYHKLRLIVILFIRTLHHYNIQLEFIGDGSHIVPSEEGCNKLDEWTERGKQQLQNINSVKYSMQNTLVPSSIITSFSSLTPMMSRELLNAVHETGAKVWFSTGEADVLLAQRMARHNDWNLSTRILGILSNDTDFAIFNKSALIPLSLFDPHKRVYGGIQELLEKAPHLLVPGAQISEIIPLEALECRIFTSKSVAKLLRLSCTELPELSILAGNDFTKHFVPNQFTNQPCKYGMDSYLLPCQGKIKRLAELLRSHRVTIGSQLQACVERVPGVNEFLVKYPEYKRAILFSRQFYGNSPIYSITSTKPTPKSKQNYIIDYVNPVVNAEICLYEKHNRQGGAGPIDLTSDLTSMNVITQLASEHRLPKWAVPILISGTMWFHCALEFEENSELRLFNWHADPFRILYAAVGRQELVKCYVFEQGSQSVKTRILEPAAIPSKLLWNNAVIANSSNSLEQQDYLSEVSNELLSLIASSWGKSYKLLKHHNFFDVLNLLMLAARFFKIKDENTGTFEECCDEDKSNQVFFQHEIESAIVSSLIAASRCPIAMLVNDVKNALPKTFNPQSFFKDDSIIDIFKIGSPDSNLPKSRHSSEIPVTLRFITVQSWLETMILIILDVYTLYKSTAKHEYKHIPPHQIFDAGIFQLIYIAGAIDYHKEHKHNFEDTFNCPFISKTLTQLDYVDLEYVRIIRKKIFTAWIQETEDTTHLKN